MQPEATTLAREPKRPVMPRDLCFYTGIIMLGLALYGSVDCLWSIALLRNADAIVDLLVVLLTAGLNASLPTIPGGLSWVSG